MAQRPLPPAPLRTLFDQVAARFPGHTMQRIRTPDGRFRYTYASPGMRETFGIDPELVLSQREADHSWVHPEDRDRFIAALHRSADRLETLDEEVRVVRPDGQLKWVRSIGTPRRLADGTVVWDGIALDVTERRAAAEALERAVALARAAEAARWEATRGTAPLQSDLLDLADAVGRLVARLPADLACSPEAMSVRQALARLTGRRQALQDVPAGPAAQRLTPRQQTVLALICAGNTNRQIADRLGTTEGTAKLHVAAVLRRLGVANRTEAAMRALRGLA
jgi:PAS domain S-box-containing protein